MPLTHNVLGRRGWSLAGLVALAAGLEVAAAAGLASVAGFGHVSTVLGRFRPGWLIGVGVAVVVSIFGYSLAYRKAFRADRGPSLRPRQMAAVVVAGFGGFLAHGGGALDTYALESAGTDPRDARVRVAALGGMEHGMLGVVAMVAGIIALIEGLGGPPLDLQWPWAAIPVPGFAIAFWLAYRYRDRFRDAEGWRARVGVFLDSIDLVRQMFRHPVRHGIGPAGMILFWLADLFGAWCAMAAFGFQMEGAAFVLGFATGAVFTRRTGPLGGAGVLMAALPATLWYTGAPLATAVVGIFVFRVFTMWLPMPFAFAALPTLRQLGHQRVEGARDEAESERGEPALEGPSA